MGEEKKKEEAISRRKYLGAVGGLATATVVGWGLAGYLASRPSAPGVVKTITETKTITVTPTPVTTPLSIQEQVPTWVGKPYVGQKIIQHTEAGLQEEQFHYYGAKYEELTGCKVDVSPTPVGYTYEKLLTELMAGTRAYDILFLIPMWAGDVMGGGYLLPLDDYFKTKDPWLDDILPIFRERYMKWGEHWYGVTSDGDVFNMYYRKDIIDKPPETWDEYVEMASTLRKNGFYGTAEDCIKGEVRWWFINRFAAYGGRFFNPDTMDPEINSPAGIKALENQINTLKYCPPGNLEWDCTKMRNAFYQGNIGFFIDWPDPGLEVENPELSKVTGDKTGFALIPGSREVWDNDNKTWVKADDLPSDIKKNHVFNGVYHSASLGYGCVLCITKTCKYPDAAYDFIRYFTSPKISLEVVMDKYVLSGLDPYRYSHINSKELQERTPGYKEFLRIENLNINSGYPDPRIRGGERYFDVLETYILKALAGEMNAKQALDTVANEWKKITDELGREDLLKQWQASPHTPYGP